MFWIGLLVGLILAAPLGMLLMALCVVARGDTERQRARRKSSLYVCADPECGLEDE
jgi:hypothetical protein